MTLRDNTALHALLMDARARTELWWRRRQKCKMCAHLRVLKNGAMNCDAVTSIGRHGDNNCVTAREEGGQCGPGARLWDARRD